MHESMFPLRHNHRVRCGRRGRFEQICANFFFLVVGDVVVQLDFKKIGLTFSFSFAHTVAATKEHVGQLKGHRADGGTRRG
jgi:hypothetical protein